jgi:hypothetical protein
MLSGRLQHLPEFKLNFPPQQPIGYPLKIQASFSVFFVGLHHYFMFDVLTVTIIMWSVLKDNKGPYVTVVLCYQ